jgi:hypothetical protein
MSSVIGSVVEYNVANVVARVRFPDDALFLTTNSACTPFRRHTFLVSAVSQLKRYIITT